ncbi:aminotransferase class I/II-fold pyridoxal phosphate-dependent enzyme [Streptomyces sp. NPDC055036]
MLTDSGHDTQLDRAAIQGGDTRNRPGIRLDLSGCTNRTPAPTTAEVSKAFAASPERLVMPPYGDDEKYIRAFADHLHVDAAEVICGRGVTEFIYILARLLHYEDVALITPDYTTTMEQFKYAEFIGPQHGQRDTKELRLLRLGYAMERHSHVMLSNPSNPLGHYLDQNCLSGICRQNPDCVLILDEEYIEFQGPGLSMAGADLENLVVLQSSGKTYGITGTRAGIMWTRNRALLKDVADQIPPWLSRFDVEVAVAAIRDTSWFPQELTRIHSEARLVEELLRGRFGDAVSQSDCHYRFVHLPDPKHVAAHLESCGVAVRMFDGQEKGTACGMRLAATLNEKERSVLAQALHSLRRAK